jgi:hypothetical protein
LQSVSIESAPTVSTVRHLTNAPALAAAAAVGVLLMTSSTPEPEVVYFAKRVKTQRVATPTLAVDTKVATGLADAGPPFNIDDAATPIVQT